MSAFDECTSLKSIVIPEGVTAIEEATFQNCIALESITLPSTLKRIGMFAFRYTTALRELVLPEGLERIEFGAFYYSQQLTITIPASVTYIDDIAFGQQQGLKILFPRNSHAAWWAESYGIPFEYIVADEPVGDFELLIDANGMITGCTGAVSKLIIPAEVNGIAVRGIADSAFLENYTITHVELPEGLTSIGYESFALCDGMVSIKLPTTLKTIGLYAFNLCSSLESIEIPKGVTALEDGTFYCCYKLKSIKLPSTLETIGSNVFDSNNHLLRVDLPQGLTAIGSSAFSWSGLKAISIPDSVIDIADDTFGHCEQVTVICKPGSAAEAFAQEHGILYVIQ